MKIKLTFLDKIAPLSYSNPVAIILNNDTSYVIGWADIITDSAMNHFAEVKLNEDISTDLFFYYDSKNVEGDVYNLSHFTLHNTPRSDKPYTTTLKEMIADF